MKLVLVQPVLDHALDATNMDAVAALLAPLRGQLGRDDVVLLPERFHLDPSRERYESDIRQLSRTLGCHVVGGSHHEQRKDGAVNSGIVANADGTVVAHYDKLRPYAAERQWVRPGDRLGELDIGGRHVLVLVCADFWFSDLFDRAARLPDLVLVPALSVTRKPTPDYSRSLWRHLAVARAYEFGAFVGVSDWSHASRLPMLAASGVGGFADPTAIDPARFFTPNAEGGVSVLELDFDALETFRQDRTQRGFFWKPAE